MVLMAGNTLIGMGQRMAMRGHIISKEHHVNYKEVLEKVYEAIYFYLKTEK
jgi:hypothetical protein